MSDDLLAQVINQAPNVIGLLIAIYLQHRVLTGLIATNARLQEALINRENCEDPTP